MALPEDATVGERIAFYRRRRQMTQAVLSGLLGRSEEWLSQLERGARSVDRLTTIVEVARILRIEPARLLPAPFFAKPRPAGESGALGTAPDWVPAIRATMMRPATGERRTGELATDELATDELATDELDDDPVDVAALTRTVELAFGHSQTERWSELGPMLPGLLADVHHAVAVRENPQTLGLMSLAYRVTSGMLDRIGEPHLPWIAAERASVAAERSEDPLLIAGAAWRWSVVLRHAGELADSHAVPVAAAERLLRHVERESRQTPRALSVYGSLLLKGAVAAASLDDRALMSEHLSRARSVAERIGETNHFWFAFGPTNVAIHRVWLDLELGDPVSAARQAAAVRVDALPAHLAERRVSHLITVAWAHYLRRKDDLAIAALFQAKAYAPEQLLFTRRVADMLTGMQRRDRRGRRDLRSLATFAGIR